MTKVQIEHDLKNGTINFMQAIELLQAYLDLPSHEAEAIVEGWEATP